MTLKELLKTGEKKLLQAGITEYDIDAWLLLSYVTGSVGHITMPIRIKVFLKMRFRNT